MKLRPVQVDCYEGSRADERPRRVISGSKKHIRVRLLNSSVEESLASKSRTRRYSVLTDEGLLLDLVLASDGRWYLERERSAKQ